LLDQKEGTQAVAKIAPRRPDKRGDRIGLWDAGKVPPIWKGRELSRRGKERRDHRAGDKI